MPINNMKDRGTEKDGSKSSEYCKYCYQDGEFTDSDMTLEKMENVISWKMKEKNFPQALLQRSLSLLPHLKRWKLNGKGKIFAWKTIQ